MSNYAIRMSTESGMTTTLGPATPALQLTAGLWPAGRISPSTLSLKVQWNQGEAVEKASEFIRSFATAVLFEFDVNHGVLFSLVPHLPGPRAVSVRARGATPGKEAPPMVPRQAYNEEAVSLYTYASSAHGLPLLQFLAYYQVLEYFFPVYGRAELVQRFRREFRDPRFNPANDRDVARLVQILAGSGKGYMPESSQLEATIKHCVDENALMEFLTETTNRSDFFTGKQELKGAKSLNFDTKAPSIITQVAARIYQIRCRIVHSKEDGGAAGVEMLLPLGPESRSLFQDISLVRFIAQKVLIMAATPAPWR